MEEQKSNYITIYEGKSLDRYLSVKQMLNNNNIKFIEKTAKNDNWFKFLVRLIFVGTGSYGMNEEHNLNYSIEVEENDYAKISSKLNE